MLSMRGTKGARIAVMPCDPVALYTDKTDNALGWKRSILLCTSANLHSLHSKCDLVLIVDTATAIRHVTVGTHQSSRC